MDRTTRGRRKDERREPKEKVAEEGKKEGGGVGEKRGKGGGKTERSQGNRCVSPGQIRLGDVIKIGKMCLMNIHLCLDLLILNGLGSRFASNIAIRPLRRRHAAD